MRGREGGRAGGAARRGRHARPLSVTAAPGGGAGRAGVCVPACLGRCPRPLPGEGIREAAGVRTVHWTPYNWHTEHPRDESIRWPTRRRAAAVTAAVRRQRARAAQQARAGAPHGLVSQRAVPCTGRPVQSVPAVRCRVHSAQVHACAVHPFPKVPECRRARVPTACRAAAGEGKQRGAGGCSRC